MWSINGTTVKEADVRQLNALALAYLGDAVYEVYVRYYLIAEGKVRPHRLHKEATSYVSAKAQSKALHLMWDEQLLTDEEEAVVRRGRNAKSGSVPKSTDHTTYRYSTAFEALIGYLHMMQKEDRIKELLSFAFQGLEEKAKRSET